MCYDTIERNVVNWSSLFSGLYQENIRTPECQRIIDHVNLESIIHFQEEMFLKYKTYKFIGAITFCLFNGKKYLVDGQHRYHAMKSLYEKYHHDYECYVEYIHVSSMKQLKEVYEIINKNTPLPELNIEIDQEDKSILGETTEWFQKTYPHIWSKNIRARRPFLFFNSFQETLSFILKHVSISSSEKLIDILMDYNSRLGDLDIENFGKGISQKMHEKAKSWDFYLGLYSFDMNQEWGYEWAKKIVEYHCPELKLKKKMVGVKKKGISKSLRCKVWNKWVGDTIGQTMCIVCQNNKISMMEFECGHIISEANGGNTDIDNLLPICGICNKSMGTMHMEEFVSSQFPKNMNSFKERKYSSMSKPKKSGFSLF